MRLLPALGQGLVLALGLLALSAPAHAQFSGPEYQTDAKNSSGRDLDNLKEKVDSYNEKVPAKPNVYVIDGNAFEPISAADQAASMGAGVNLFEGDDGYFAGKPSKFSDADIQRIADAGFKTIRVPLFAFTHIADTQGNLDEGYLKRIDHLIDLATQAHLNIILDEHNYNECAKDADGCAVLLSNVWYDLALRYQNAPNNVMFELLNEPNGKVDADIWNGWIPDLVAQVRDFNKTRNIIIGPDMWNSIGELDKLKLPADDHIIVTFHYYEPFHFTHQGASWAGPEVQALRDVHWTGTADQMAALNADFDKAAAWAKANNRPLFLGEFGSYGLVNKDMDDRAAWTRAVSQAAADRGIPRALWVYEGSGGFGIHDEDGNTWVEPLKNALLLK